MSKPDTHKPLPAVHTAETVAKIRETLPDFAKTQPKPAPALELSAQVVAGLNDLLLTISRIKELLG